MSQENVEMVRDHDLVTGVDQLLRLELELLPWLKPPLQVLARPFVAAIDVVHVRVLHRRIDLNRRIDRHKGCGHVASSESLQRYRQRGRGKGSGIEVENMLAAVATMRDGKVIRGHVYLDRAAALKAAGLSD